MKQTAKTMSREDFRKACREYPSLDKRFSPADGYCLKSHCVCNEEVSVECKRMQRYDKIHKDD